MRLFRLGARARVDYVEPDVILEDLSHQTVDRASARYDGMEYAFALGLLLQQTLDSSDLASDAAHPVEQLGLVPHGVDHKDLVGDRKRG